jgi:hypothetical protein
VFATGGIIMFLAKSQICIEKLTTQATRIGFDANYSLRERIAIVIEAKPAPMMSPMLFGARIAVRTAIITKITAKTEVQTMSRTLITQLGIYFSSFLSFLGATTPKSGFTSSSG